MANNEKEWRLSMTLTKEQEEAIFRIRQLDEYRRCSIAEIVRRLIDEGLKATGHQG